MASRSLGTLTLDLIAKIGGFESGMDRAARTAARKAKEIAADAKRRAKETEETWSKVGSVIGSMFAGITVGAAASKLISVQREFDVLNSSLTTVTGSSAAAEREMAWIKQFAKETPFGLAQATEGFVKMQALGLNPTRASLTSFGNTASAMGKDLNQMIEAVADASTGEFERLKEFGIKASKEGDKVSLTFQGVTKTIGNNSAEITGYLESIGNTQFAGAMEERAKTLDGVIAGLGDNWDELFRTVNSNNTGSLIFDGFTLANRALEDAITILTAMEGASQDMARETGALISMQAGLATVFEAVAVMGVELKYVLLQTGDTLGGLAALYKEFFSFNFDGARSVAEGMRDNGRAARAEVDATTARILSARKDLLLYESYATRNASAATDPRRVDLPVSGNRPEKPPQKPEKAKTDPTENAARAYIQQLNDQIGKLNELTAVEKVLYDLQLGKVKLTHDQKDIALGLAQEVDGAKALAEQKKADLELTVAQINAQRDFNAEMDRYARLLDGMGMGNAAREKSAGLAQINDKYDAEYRRLEDSKRQAVYDDKWTAQAEARHAKELLMLQGFQAKAVESYTTYYDQLKAKEGSMWLGASEAMANYASDSANLFAQSEDAMTRALRGMEDALVSFVSTGKLDFKGLADSIISDLVRIQAKAAVSGIMQFLTPIISAAAGDALGMSIGGTYGANTQAGLDNLISSNGWSTGGYTGPGGKYEPAGLVHKGEGVLSQEDMSALGGPGGFAALRRSLRNGFPDGGFVGSMPAIARGGGAGSGGSDMQLTIVNQTRGRIDNVHEQRISPTERALIISEAVDAAWSQPSNPNSKASKTLSSAYNLRRSR